MQFYQDSKDLGLDTASILKDWEAQEYTLSPCDVQAGLRALKKALSEQQQFELQHPKTENLERRREFDDLCASAAEMAELYGLDICTKVDSQLVGHINIRADILLLRREYAFDFLPLLTRLMEICDEFLLNPCEKNGETLVSLSFDVPLYTRA